MSFKGEIEPASFTVTDVIIAGLGLFHSCTFHPSKEMRKRLAKGVELLRRDGIEFTANHLAEIVNHNGNKKGVLAERRYLRLQQGIRRILDKAPRSSATPSREVDHRPVEQVRPSRTESQGPCSSDLTTPKPDQPAPQPHADQCSGDTKRESSVNPRPPKQRSDLKRIVERFTADDKRIIAEFCKNIEA